MRGASIKEAATLLDVSPRNMKFGHANMVRKCGTKDTADLVRKVPADLHFPKARMVNRMG